MKIEIMNKQGRQAEKKVLYRALAIGALVWGAIYLAIATGVPWLLAPVIGIYSLMFLAPLEGVYEGIWRRIKKQGISEKRILNPLLKRHRATPLRLFSQTGSQDMQDENLQEEGQVVAKTSQQSAA